ncbi:MAG: hypothetical protein Kow00109_18090 [Acidobacteriota bacterium]
MPTAEPQVSVIVVNRNGARWLAECLESLQRQRGVRFEVIVVDNGSHDESVEVVRRYPPERFRLERLVRNEGFAAACNHGIRLARGAWVALLNNDAVAAEDWLAEMLACATRHPGAGMVACKILQSATGRIDKAGHLIYWDGQNRGRGTGMADGPAFSREGEALFPDGCAALYRRELLAETGGLDEDFFAYADDADLGLRARWLGWSCVYCPTAVVYHRHSATAGELSPGQVYWIERNRLWLAVKTLPWPVLLLNPLFTGYRWLWNAVAAWLGRGPAGAFRRQESAWRLARVITAAFGDGLRGVPRCRRRRRELMRRRRLGTWGMLRILWRWRISARRLAFGPVEPADGNPVNYDSGRWRSSIGRASDL